MSRKTPLGGVGLVLHAHLPFVRHPEYDDFLEEDWLFEAITETYVPLAEAMLRLLGEGVPFRLTMTVTAPLAAMLEDALLGARYRRHLGRLTELAELEARGNAAGTPVGKMARHYLERFVACARFLDRWGGVLPAFRELAAAGVLEIIASTATHGLLPLMSRSGARRAQVQAGVRAHALTFGKRPRGLWLAECGYDHGVDALLGEVGVEYLFLESQGLAWGRPAPRHGVFAPVRTPGGPAAFARDEETGRQVWSAEEGYPGDPFYREFYRDLGWDADYDTIRPYLHADGVRRGVGIKYHRVTGRVGLGDKALYDPDIARERAHVHAHNFVFNRKHQIRHLAGTMDRPPLVVACYDAELFGHWWYEGPMFLEEVLRALHAEPDIASQAPVDVLDRGDALEAQRPNPSTWGAGGTNKVWLEGRNAWLYPHQHWAEGEMAGLVRRFAGGKGLAARALRQAGRELLLLQSSDWAFILSSGTTAPYASRRFKEHLLAFEALREGLLAGRLREPEVAARETRTPIFPDLDVAAWAD